MKPALALGCAILAAATALRVADLGARPMHADESILADKFGTLLETGRFGYDPRDYHGPALLYCTLPVAWLTGAARYVDLSETTLRIVPAVAGIALVLAPLLLAPQLGPRSVLAAAGLTAVSPAMVFYSRYYIPEMLMVLFTFGAIGFGLRYAVTGRLPWALLAGVSVGLMFATKETATIALGAMMLAQAATARPRPRHWWHVAAGCAAALTVVAMWPGIPALFASWTHYLERGLQPALHRHSWHYYLGLLIWFRESGGPPFSEVLILAGGGAGLTAALFKPGLPRFLAVYTLAMTLVYALIPYKTPWCLLGFLHGWILLAGWAAGTLLPRAPATRAAAIAAVSILAAQAVTASFLYSSHPANPYVYAHTARDVFTIRDRVEQLARAHQDARNMRVQVIGSRNMWPLPWYLRSFPRIEWWTGVRPDLKPAPVIITSPEFEAAVAERIYHGPPGEREMYLPIFDRHTELRPGVELRGYARKSLWDRSQRDTPRP